jgi:hypothetical protein
MLLGALTKQMDDRALFSPKPTTPFLGFSIAALAESIREMAMPYQCQCRSNSYSYDAHRFSMAHYLDPLAEALEVRAKDVEAELKVWADSSMDEEAMLRS